MVRMRFWCVLSLGFFLGVMFVTGCGSSGTSQAIGQTLVNAIEVAFDNTSNGMTSTEVQSAIEELNQKIALLETVQGAEAMATTTITLTGAINELQARITTLETENTQLVSWANALDSAAASAATTIAGLETKTAAMSVSGNEHRFTGVNVNIRNGAGSTATNNSVGNLIVGYNHSIGDTRTGSHNLIIGDQHSYTSYGCLVAGFNNTVSNIYSTVSGGQRHTASGKWSSVSGGYQNTASGDNSSILGGSYNKATNQDATIGGGDYNTASGAFSTVSGGSNNTADEKWSAIGGGDVQNTSSQYQFLP